LPRYSHFRMEPRKDCGILRYRDRQEFDGDDLSELQVFGAVDFAHSAPPEKRDNAIAFRDDRSRCETAAADWIAAGKQRAWRR
jgi:hypothetical protein